jgi:hypothetical protein
MTKWDIELGGGEHSTTTEPYMTLVEGHIDAEPDEYGAVTAGSITVRGPLVEVRRRSVALSAEDAGHIAALNSQISLLGKATTAQLRESASNLTSQTASRAGHGFVRTQGGLVFEYFQDDEVEPSPVEEQGVYKCLFDGWEKPCPGEGCACKEGWSEGSFWCLRVSRVAVREKSRSTRIQDGWLVLRRSVESDAYERVGVGYFGNIESEAKEFKLFNDAVETLLQII